MRALLWVRRGVRIDRWDTARDWPHLPRLSINIQPRVCGYSESACVVLCVNEMRETHKEKHATDSLNRHFVLLV